MKSKLITHFFLLFFLFVSFGLYPNTSGEIGPNDYTVSVSDFSRDRTLFDSDMARGNNNAEVRLSGTSNAPNGYTIEARAVSTDDGGAATITWQTIAEVNNGSWSGIMNTPRSSSW